MKQYKLRQKTQEKPSAGQSPTRQEIDEIAKHLANHIEKNPAKAAKLFEAWLGEKPKNKSNKNAA